MITVDDILATNPCEDYPPERVLALFADHGPFETWEDLAVRLRGTVPASDLLLTFLRAATQEYRVAFARDVVRRRIELQAQHWPTSPPDELLAWVSGETSHFPDAEAMPGHWARSCDVAYGLTFSLARLMRHGFSALEVWGLVQDIKYDISLGPEHCRGYRDEAWTLTLKVCRHLDTTTTET